MQTPRDLDSDLALAEVTLARADSLLSIDLGAADTIDIKAVGLATAGIAALTIIIVFHRSVPIWWAPTALMTASGVFFFLTLRQQKWVYAPDIPAFRTKHSGKSRVQLLEAMRDEVLEAYEKNGPLVDDKARWFQWGYRCLAAGLIVLLAGAVWRLLF